MMENTLTTKYKQTKREPTKGASGEPPAPYGKYQNVFLTESEYAELKQEYPDSLERLIEEMSRYIASSGNDYVNHAAALQVGGQGEKGEPEKGNPRLFFQRGREPLTAEIKRPVNRA